MKMTKRSFKFYAAWEYEKEEADLNAASKAGWHLVKGGSFSSLFRRDESVQYVYQLDYSPRIQDIHRYKETFEEQGWEYISSTFNGWHYFCKLYQEGKAAEEYRIYTDRESLYEMQNRWIKIATALFFIYLILTGVYTVHFIQTKETSWLLQSIVFMILTATFGLGVQNLRRRRKGFKGNMGLPMQVILPLVVVLLISAMNLAGSKRHNLIYHSNFNYINKPENVLKLSDDIVIEKKGKYKLDLEMATSEGEMQVIIQDSNKNKVFDVVADRCTINNHKILLEAGTYAIHFNYLAGNHPVVTSKSSITIKLKK